MGAENWAYTPIAERTNVLSDFAMEEGFALTEDCTFFICSKNPPGYKHVTVVEKRVHLQNIKDAVKNRDFIELLNDAVRDVIQSERLLPLQRTQLTQTQPLLNYTPIIQTLNQREWARLKTAPVALQFGSGRQPNYHMTVNFKNRTVKNNLAVISATFKESGPFKIESQTWSSNNTNADTSFKTNQAPISLKLPYAICVEEASKRYLINNGFNMASGGAMVHYHCEEFNQRRSFKNHIEKIPPLSGLTLIAQMLNIYSLMEVHAKIRFRAFLEIKQHEDWEDWVQRASEAVADDR